MTSLSDNNMARYARRLQSANTPNSRNACRYNATTASGAATPAPRAFNASKLISCTMPPSLQPPKRNTATPAKSPSPLTRTNISHIYKLT